jgi:hypothetical protein
VKDVDPTAKPSGMGCVECLASGCTARGHVGCSDNSPSQHARKHVHESWAYGEASRYSFFRLNVCLIAKDAVSRIAFPLPRRDIVPD